jgi:signal-transduction protein with cAMP-binding, CBS, and nucleotidyltransferase domain
VQRVAQSLAEKQQNCLPENDWFFKQILFLKTTKLFNSLSLDELLVINASFNQKDFHSGEIISDKTKGIKELYLIYQGILTVIDQSEQEQQFHQGRLFWRYCPI